ncbi:MAG: alcohol dehydrogenase catalytic domain-containing protein, partial [Aeoliella sp.]
LVGRVKTLGTGVTKHKLGDRVGVGWIHSSSGEPDENLSAQFDATGRDSNGGYAEWMTVHEDYAFPIPDCFSSTAAAPLLCAGAVGFRALKLTNLKDGQLLGLTGFGGSAHLVLQVVRHQFPHSLVFVFARDSSQRELARKLGAVWAGDTTDVPPAQLDAIIDTTPAWGPIVSALAHLKPGGRLIINAIRKEEKDKEQLMHVSYHDHLWMEKEIKTVANVTQHDIQQFLPLAAKISLQPKVTIYPLEDANRALVELKRGHVEGSKVLRVSQD